MSGGNITSETERPVVQTAWATDRGEMAALIQGFDWSQTSLGPMESWSPTLRIMVPFLLVNRFPLLLWWGPDYVSIYNDAYSPVLGAKHPWALGKPVSECWSEIWHVLRPLIDEPFHGGPATWNDDIELEINRNGFLEETHFTIAYSPVPDEAAENGIGGVLATVTEITEKVIGERRILALRDLASRSGEAHSAAEACAIATDTLGKHERDIPFALLYLLDSDRKYARLAGATGLEAGHPFGVDKVALTSRDNGKAWPFQMATSTTIVENLGVRFACDDDGKLLEFSDKAAVLPLSASSARDPTGFLVAGINSRLKLDEHYHDFLELMKAQVVSAIANAQSREDERKRSEALAEIDRAKTVFFSNVSHEFRTPLTLMIGHIEDLLSHRPGPTDDREQLLIAHRNSLRLLKLVNTLLEFSRIEAGRLQASFVPTDLPAATAELASAFRSATEKAGLRLIVDTPPLAETAHVDRQMWEKIVLNLLSNAFKFTLEGEIEVRLAIDGPDFVLTVRDTGIGVPDDELPRLFERFHRVEGAEGRTQEGSGIGLAFVQELVRLHGGAVSARSILGKGTTLRVSIPRGRAHLSHDHTATPEARTSTAIGATPFVEEALRWLPDDGHADTGLPEIEPAPTVADAHNHARECLLVVDDNADMRDYLRRLFGGRYELDLVGSGDAALSAVAARKPHLVLTDIMIPGFDGLELLRRLRADPQTNTIPIILLSARAGEESRIEGMRAGADDYMIKPFSARELLARVEAHLKIARYRTKSAERLKENETRFRAFVTATSDVVYRMGPDWREMRFLQGKDFVADTEDPSESWLEKYVPADDQGPILARIGNAIRDKAIFEMEHRVIRVDGSLGWTYSRAIPVLGPDDEIVEWFGAARDITARKQSEETQKLLLSELSHRVKNMLATVQAIANQTLRSAKDPTAFAESFSGRLQSMSRMHTILSRTGWQGADFEDIIRDQLPPAALASGRVATSGPNTRFDAQTATHMAMILHELCTNAAKYGSLSMPDGTVAVVWSVHDGLLSIAWTERGGPVVQSPAVPGFGTKLIKQIASSGGGSAQGAVDASGMTWKIEMPMEAEAALSTADVSTPLATVPTDAAAGLPSLKGKRFVVIEDEALIAFEIASILEREHAEVAGPASTVGDALHIIEQEELDAALVDANLRGQPVGEIATALTQKQIPFVFVTGYGREALPSGFANATMLAKPFDPEQLLKAAALLVARPNPVLRFRH
ncbi:MAG TPA: response regulator [Ensifer sp.]|jgi:signal transduction histidine kinase/DNA-binding response OmpR family regulator|uniref:response regulator n=1 Tax=Ensifer sp. TaxID=1872086 RepID=UPI002E15E5AE|nr:response regulator [Ensifer sp.]